ncbi:MAG: hypothetical protein J5J00_15505 [Deltaproteobacteria bacterium]|nr:hypothetical protein [Deltaproteobacteria bacterium]
MDNSSEIQSAETAVASSVVTDTSDAETLVVVSKVKKLVRSRAGLNTSQCCIDALTRKVVEAINGGIESARKSGRKTVMGRDIA